MEFWNWLSGVLAGLGQILAAEKAPWWGIPLITGAATLFGALVAFGSTWASDRRKAKREKKDKQIEDTREAANELISLGREIETLVMMQETKARALDAREYVKATMDNAMRLKDVWATFELQAMKSTLKPGEEFFKVLLVLVIPTVDSKVRLARLNAYSVARLNFVNSLRTMAGLAKIDRTPGKMQTREEFEAKHGGDWEKQADEILRRHPPKEDTPNPEATKGETEDDAEGTK